MTLLPLALSTWVAVQARYLKHYATEAARCVVLSIRKQPSSHCRSRKLSVQKFDLETDIFNDDRAFDLAVSMEVAEHLPQTCADRYIDLLARLSPVIVFTAAPPGQGGTAHLNEQPLSYWISKFQERGFSLAEELSRRWRENWDAAGDVKHWYWQNLMIFQKPSR